jgi:orotidine-5'-phosphate decarboxylase
MRGARLAGAASAAKRDFKGIVLKHKDIPSKDRLIFAMDVPTVDRARELADELGDAVTFYKIGLELMMSGHYFELLDWMLERDKKVFCDLKFFDIPATVGSAVRSLKDRGATFVTVHGNRSIMEAAAENKGDTLKVLGVTVLTSLDRGDLDDLGFDCDIDALVLSRAKQCLEAGCDGVISSGLEVPKLREFVNEKLLVVSPGIRPVDNKPVGDQKRVVTVATAFDNGCDYIVVGRPIRDAEEPRAAAEMIQAQIAEQVGS